MVSVVVNAVETVENETIKDSVVVPNEGVCEVVEDGVDRIDISDEVKVHFVFSQCVVVLVMEAMNSLETESDDGGIIVVLLLTCVIGYSDGEIVPDDIESVDVETTGIVDVETTGIVEVVVTHISLIQ